MREEKEKRSPPDIRGLGAFPPVLFLAVFFIRRPPGKELREARPPPSLGFATVRAMSRSTLEVGGGAVGQPARPGLYDLEVW